MKKIIAFLLALSFCIIFSACGGSAPETSEEVMSTPAQTQNDPSSGEDVSYNCVHPAPYGARQTKRPPTMVTASWAAMGKAK